MRTGRDIGDLTEGIENGLNDMGNSIKDTMCDSAVGKEFRKYYFEY